METLTRNLKDCNNDFFIIGKTMYPYIGTPESIPKIIRQIVAYEFNIKVDDIVGGCREENIVTARHLFHAIIYQLVQKERIKRLSLRSIGDLTNRNHATVLHSVGVINDSTGEYRRELNNRWRKIVEQFTEREPEHIEECVCCGRKKEKVMYFEV